MNIRYVSIFLSLFLLICCASTVYAASDDSIMELDQNKDLISTEGNEIIATSNDDIISSSQEEIISNTNKDTLSSTQKEIISNTNEDTLSSTQEEIKLTATANSSASGSSVSSTSTTLSPYKQFLKDLDAGKKTVNLTGNIKISKPIEIRHNVVIDGKNHVIDGQKKTCIFNIFGSTVTIKNLVLKNGKNDNGGAIRAIQSKVTINKCTFKNNKATENGGAIYTYIGKLRVYKSTFTSNFAKLNGGGIYVSTANLIIKNSKFKSNKIQNGKKDGHGGAVYTYKKSSIISDSSFTSNYALSTALKSHKKATKYQFSAGAIYYNLGGTHKLIRCNFTSNKASNHGGAVYSLKSKTVKMSKCIFKANKACWEDGGAITFNGNKLVITNSKFYNNHAYEDGGVMDACSQTKKKIRIIVSGSTFDSNNVYKGGGVFWLGKKSIWSLTNNKFIKNEAGIGGALFAEDCNIKIKKCSFIANKAKKVAPFKMTTKGGGVLKHCGGAIMIQHRTVKIIKSTFKNNRATYGGAIFHKSGKLSQSGNKYIGNKASKSGNNIKR